MIADSVRDMQLQFFPKRIVDLLARVPGGVTAPQWVRADDGLSYIVKDEAPGVASVRASEYIWLSVARQVGLPAPLPEVIVDHHGRKLIGTRREHSTIDDSVSLSALLSGGVVRGGTHLSRIYSFDLFSGNWDRHPGNYLVLLDGASIAVFAIDFSHVAVHPGLTPPIADPLIASGNATRAYFPQVVQPYGVDVAAAIEIADRLALLPATAINSILKQIPEEWLSEPDKALVASWWAGQARLDRAELLKQGLQNGTLI